MKRIHSSFAVGTLVLALLGASGQALANAGACPGTWRTLTPASSGAIIAVEELPDGRVVVGTATNGLRVYGPNAQGGYQWSSIVATLGGLASNRVNDLAIFKNELWVATDDRGISIQDLATGAWRTVNAVGSALPDDTVNRLTVVPAVRGSSNPSIAESSVWASTPTGAAHYHRVQIGGQATVWVWTVIDESDGLPDQDVLDVAVHDMFGERTTWFATSTQLVRWDGTTFADASYHCDMTTATRIAVDGQNDLWFNGIREVPALAGGTWVPVGVCRARPGMFGTLSWTHFPEQYGWDMSVDRAGRLWLAQRQIEHTGGAALYDQETWCVFDAAEVPLFSNNVSAAGAVGEVAWYGHADAAKVSTFSRNWSIVTAAEIGDAGAPGPILLYLDATYVGAGTGVSLKFEDDPYWHHDNLEGNPAQVTALYRSGTHLYIGTAGNGLLERDETTGDVSQVAGLPNEEVRDIRADYTGRLWAATAGGLAVRGNGYWLSFNTSNSSLASNDVRAIRFDTLGRLWVGTAQGVTILDPDPAGSSEDWTQVGTAEGLPSASVTALAVQPNGFVWVGTDAGAARWDPAAGQWTIFGSQNGALPDDRVTSIASSIGGGKLWIGTAGGLVLHDGGAWRHFHVPGSTLGSDWIRHIAADGKVLLASAGNTIAVRADLEGPLGNFIPEIDSVVPNQGSPGTVVTIIGDHFDDRGAEFNTVTIGQTEALSDRKAPPAEIVSVTKTTLQFKVPELARSGKVRVTANCLSAETTANFNVAPRIDSFTPSCVGPGGTLTIRGAGFAGFGACEVQIGSGDWRTPILTAPDNQGVDWISIRTRPGDTTGKVRVRNGNGLVAVSAQSLTVGSLQSSGRRIQQAIQGTRLIWGKRTLVHIDFDGSGCSTEVDGGVLYWKKKDGTRVRGGIAYSTRWMGIAVPVGGDITVDDNFGGLDYIAEFESNRSGQTPFFALSQFDGVEVVVKNNAIEVLTVTIPASEFNFLEMGEPIRFRTMAVAPPSNGTQNDEFWRTAFDGWAHTARIYPQQDVAWYGNSRAWFSYTPIYLTFDEVMLGEPGGDAEDGNYYEVVGAVEDYLDPPCGMIGVGLIDDRLYEKGAAGRAPYGCLGATAMVFNEDGIMGKTVAHEGGHTLGLSVEEASNHDSENEHHSKYDEGVAHDDGENAACADATDLTFRQALLDQLGWVPRVYSLDDGPPKKMASGFCSTGRPKSLMSYAPGRRNENSFLEPTEYQILIDRLQALAQYELCHASGGGGGAGDGGGGATHRRLHLRGSLTRAGAMTVTLSYVEESTEPSLPVSPGGSFNLRLYDAGGQLVEIHPFGIATEIPHGKADRFRFGLVALFPEGTARAEIESGGQVYWSRSVSAGIPAVQLTSPTGGAFPATDPIQVAWTASDPDGDALQFALDYSPDGGATWQPLPQYLLEPVYEWTPDFVPASNDARLRVRASDGFHTTMAVSAPFAVLPRAPFATIMSPRDGAVFTEGSRVDLSAHSMTSSGPDAGSFVWSIDGVPLPDGGQSAETTLLEPGEHVIEVRVSDQGLEGAASVKVHVIADFDGDGMPNGWEQDHQLNPLALGDASEDPDGDQVSNFGEYELGTDPHQADTDGDGATDGGELVSGTDPLDPSQKPPTSPVLRVGASSLAFTVMEGHSSQPREFWVTNPGPGTLNWSAAWAESWLEISPPGGVAPAKVEVFAHAEGLLPGTYTSDVMFTSPEADTPHLLHVTLRVVESDGSPLPGFTRGDANADGQVNITDPIGTLGYLFTGNATIECKDAADADDSGTLDITDAIYSLSYLFLGASPPRAPFPGCGQDPTADAIGCQVTRDCE